MGVTSSGHHKSSFPHPFMHFNQITDALTNSALDRHMHTIIVAPVQTAKSPFPDSRWRDSISINPFSPQLFKLSEDARLCHIKARPPMAQPDRSQRASGWHRPADYKTAWGINMREEHADWAANLSIGPARPRPHLKQPDGKAGN